MNTNLKTYERIIQNDMKLIKIQREQAKEKFYLGCLPRSSCLTSLAWRTMSSSWWFTKKEYLVVHVIQVVKLKTHEGKKGVRNVLTKGTGLEMINSCIGLLFLKPFTGMPYFVKLPLCFLK